MRAKCIQEQSLGTQEDVLRTGGLGGGVVTAGFVSGAWWRAQREAPGARRVPGLLQTKPKGEASLPGPLSRLSYCGKPSPGGHTLPFL